MIVTPEPSSITTARSVWSIAQARGADLFSALLKQPQSGAGMAANLAGAAVVLGRERHAQPPSLASRNAMILARSSAEARPP